MLKLENIAHFRYAHKAMSQKVGRPLTYTPEIGREFCERFASGRFIQDVCKDEDMPSDTCIYEWKNTIPEFGAMFVAAQERYADTLIGQTVGIADSEHDAQRARNRITARQWVASKLNRERWGERVDIHSKITVDINSALSDASNRLLRPVCDQQQAIEGEYTDITNTYQLTSTDKQTAEEEELDIFS